MMQTKRCSGYKGHWECEDEHPDHMVAVEEFTKHVKERDGLDTRCGRCARLKSRTTNPKNNARYTAAAKLVGGYKKFRMRTKQQRGEILAIVDNTVEWKINNKVVDTTTRRKSEFGQSTPMTKRETTVVEGEQVPEGWVYVVYNPEVPSVLKIGKTFPDGIPSIMSSARRFGRAELADKFWFDKAYKAEQAVHAALSSCNLRSLGYSDCGVELFKCNIDDVRGAIEIEANNIK